MMFRPILCLLLMVGVVTPLAAKPAPGLAVWNRIFIEPMKTSIYVGSVTLTPSVFVRKDSTLTATYEAKVRPWFFWGETGRITITLPTEELTKLQRGERAEFTGEATNHKNKPRQVTGYAQPADAASGKIKVRIGADGTVLVFNGSYRLENRLPDLPQSAQ